MANSIWKAKNSQSDQEKLLCHHHLCISRAVKIGRKNPVESPIEKLWICQLQILSLELYFYIYYGSYYTTIKTVQIRSWAARYQRGTKTKKKGEKENKRASKPISWQCLHFNKNRIMTLQLWISNDNKQKKLSIESNCMKNK